MKKVAIIGAGLAGLSAARRLQADGCEVVVLEKSRSLGGRCASRLWEGNVVDHGAQYFTMRDPAFSEEIRRLCGNAIQRLEAPITMELGSVLPERSPRYYHAKGNNHLGRALAAGLTIHRETTVEALEAAGEKWRVAGDVYDAVLVTAPWPQAAQLLGTSIAIETFAPCLTAFFSYALPWTGMSREIYAQSRPDDDLAWSACENHKSGRIQMGQVVFVAQAGRSFSELWLEADPAEWAALLRNALELRWGLDPTAFSGQFTHRWRYARALGEVAQPALPRGLFVSGDAFSDSRVESVWLAGLAAAEKIQAS